MILKIMLNMLKKSSAGFTLIELLVVISIIGLLSSIVLTSVNSARAKARDARRKSDLHTIQTALELYYDKYGTYQVAGTGWNGCSCGWVGYEDGGAYHTAVTHGLADAGFLPVSLLDDPIQKPGYMLYYCSSDRYALSATLENPTAADIVYIQTTCNGSGGNGTYSVYGKNYAVQN